MFSGPRSATVLALSLAAALTLTGIAAASSWSRAGTLTATDTSSTAQVRRHVVWYGFPEVAPRNLHVESTSIGTPVQDEFQISYYGGTFTLVYYRTAGGPVTTQYTLTVVGLLEWNDTSGDGQVLDGSPVAFTPLGPDAFGHYPIQHMSLSTADGVGVNSFLMESNAGNVVLNLTIADGFVKLPSGQSLTPMEAKLTLEVNHTMVYSGSSLSLQVNLLTDQHVLMQNQSWDDQNEWSTDDRALNVTTGMDSSSSSTFFAWSNVASVNDVSGSVVPSGPFPNMTAPGSYDLYLTYPRPNGSLQLQVLHDPTLGVVSTAYLSSLHPPPPPPLGFQGDALVYAVSLGAIAVFVAGTIMLVSRRRRGL